MNNEMRIKRLLIEESTLMPAEMKKPMRGTKTRWDVFMEKIMNNSPFILTSGEEVLIPSKGNKALILALKMKDPDAYAAAFKAGIATNNPSFKISSPKLIVKTKEFGGTGAGSGTRAEGGQIEQINAAISKAINKSGTDSIDIKVGTEGFNKTGIAKNIIACKNVSGFPKADCVLIDKSGEEQAYISLKHASNPKEMNQWSGVSSFAGNEYLEQFINDLKSWLTKNDEIPAGKIIFRDLPPNSDLALSSAWGKGGGNINDVDVIIASKTISLKKNENGIYEFVAEHVWYAREPIEKLGWQPSLIARKGDRNDLGFERTRIGIFPSGYRDSNKKIELPFSKLSTKLIKKKNKLHAENLNILADFIRNVIKS